MAISSVVIRTRFPREWQFSWTNWPTPAILKPTFRCIEPVERVCELHHCIGDSLGFNAAHLCDPYRASDSIHCHPNLICL